MKHLRNVARESRSVARAPHIEVCQRVSGTNQLSDTHYSHIFQPLTIMCVRCVGCVSIFKLFETFLKNTVLFCKTNFNLKLPDTPDTHPFNPHGYWILCQNYLTHRLAHPDTRALVPDTHDREPRFATHI